MLAIALRDAIDFAGPAAPGPLGERHGIWLYPDGYTLTPVEDGVPWWLRWARARRYRVKLDADCPLTYIGTDGLAYQPNRSYMTDMGSIPQALQTLLPKDSFLASFLLHDSGYTFGGHWIEGEFIPLPRSRVDWLLRECVLAEGGGPAIAQAIWLAVRACGWLCGYGKRGDLAKSGNRL